MPIMVIHKKNIRGVLLTAYFVLLFSIWGCAGLQKKTIVLAVVDGEPVSEDDLEYSLQIAHRREDLSSAGTLNISEYVQKLIDDRLIVQEARRMGMEQQPETLKAVNAFLLRESVTRLHEEEILQKASVDEHEIVSSYRKDYEQFITGIIELTARDKAVKILEQLKSENNFNELAREYSTHASGKEGGEVVFTPLSMSSSIRELVYNLKPGETSDITEADGKYYIVKLIRRQEAPIEELEGVRERIGKAIRTRKEKERSEEYLKELRKEGVITVNHELLSSIKLDSGLSEREKWEGDKRLLVEGHGLTLTAEDFVSMMPPVVRKPNEDVLNTWIDRKLVDREALNRHYEATPDMKEKVQRYKNQLLRRTFIKRVILPRIQLSADIMEDYYLKHQEDYLKTVRFRIQRITVKTEEEAGDLINKLKNGADFTWTAKKRSIDSEAPKGGVLGWKTKGQMSEPLREIIDTLEPGDISPILKVDSLFRIIRLQEKTGEEIEAFDTVKASVYRAVSKEEFDKIYNEYIDKLKEEAHIEVNDRAVRAFEKKFKN